MSAAGLRIAQVSADPGITPGGTKGAALHLRGIATGLQGRGVEVTTFAKHRPAGPYPAPVVRFGDTDLAEQLAVTGPHDAVYERYSLGHVSGLEAARSCGQPFVLEVNAPLVDEASRYRPGSLAPNHREVETRLLSEADVVAVVSTPLAEWVAGVRGTDAGIVLTRNGFEADWFARTADVRNPEAPLVFLGHPKPWHGGSMLIEMLERLADRGLRPLLRVVGGGPGASELAALAEGAGVTKQLEVTGPVAPAEVASHLASASLGLAPYPHHDRFYFCPLKVIDYLAAGLPVVTSDAGDLPNLVGDAGITVPGGNVEAFSEAVAMLLGNADRRAAMGAAGRRRAMASMTWTHVAERLLAELDLVPVTT